MTKELEAVIESYQALSRKAEKIAQSLLDEAGKPLDQYFDVSINCWIKASPFYFSTSEYHKADEKTKSRVFLLFEKYSDQLYHAFAEYNSTVPDKYKICPVKDCLVEHKSKFRDCSWNKSFYAAFPALTKEEFESITKAQIYANIGWMWHGDAWMCPNVEEVTSVIGTPGYHYRGIYFYVNSKGMYELCENAEKQWFHYETDINSMLKYIDENMKPAE